MKYKSLILLLVCALHIHNSAWFTLFFITFALGRSIVIYEPICWVAVIEAGVSILNIVAGVVGIWILFRTKRKDTPERATRGNSSSIAG